MSLKNPLIPIKVYKWNSPTDKELITFDQIYQDFTIEDAVNRIGTYIKEGDLFYAWINDKPLLFDIANKKWDGYNVNPFKARDIMSPQLDEPVEYEYHNQDLFIGYKYVNIVFSSDLPKNLAKNKYYFSDLKPQSVKQYKKQDEKLASLARIDASSIKIVSENFTRINYHFKLKNITLPILFDNIHASKYIDMIQWIDDSSRVLYKLYKKHKIKNDWFRSWTNLERVNKINVINIYSVVSRSGFCKISVDSQNNVLFNYIFDARSYTRLKDVMHHKKNVIKILENIVKQKIRLSDLSLNSNIRLEAHNSVFKTFLKKIGEYIDIFHVIKSDMTKNKMSITCTYKRSSNYAQNTDIYDYIRSRIALGLGRQEIAEELNNLGVIGNIDDMIMGEMNMASHSDIPKNKINLTNNGTIVLIQPYSTGYVVNITNCPNLLEMEYMLFWLQKIIFGTVNAKAVQAQQPLQPVVLPVIPSKTPSPSQSDSSSVDQGSIDFDLDSFGGAVGKSSYLITMLQQADKELFSENYARDKCQNPSQPIVLTRDEKDALEKNNQLHFDNIIEYGSSPSIQNYYACPRLWCPQSKVPLSVDDPNAKCPLENEKPMQMIWNNDITKKRYVKLIKPNEKGMCVPCCMKKPPKADDINKCKANIANIGNVSKEEEKALSIDNSIAVDQYYIMNQSAPIPSGRYGVIPENLHNVLFSGQKVAHEQCNKVIQKSQPCFVRKGIENSKYDSIVLAICDILGFKKKKDYVKDIKKRLSIATFLSLDNGEICKQFMSMKEIVVDENAKLLKKLNAFKTANKKLWNISDDGDMARQLNIFYAYNKYLDFIAADDFHIEKNAKFVCSLMSILYGTTPLIWERVDKDGDLYLQCPGEYAMLDMIPSVCMLVKEGRYYEPIELKTRGNDITRIFKLNEFPMLQQVIMSNCFAKNNNSIYRKVYALNNWIKSKVALQNSGNFIIKRVLINNDLSISKMLTTGNILIEFENITISYLPWIMKDCGITNVMFYDDLVGKKLNIKMLAKDLDIFSDKCVELGVTLNAGNIVKSNDIEINTMLILSQDNLPSTPIIHKTNNDTRELYKTAKKNRKDKWYELQKMVATNILRKYSDEELDKLDMMKREQRVAQLMKENFSDKIPHKSKIRIILEEMPFSSLSAGIKKWLTNIVINAKYDFLSSTVSSNKNEFVFSQNAFIINGIKNIPQYLLMGYHKALPNDLHLNINNIEFNDVNVNNINSKNNETITQLPDMLLNGKPEKLGSKWIMHKKSKWSNMVFMKTEYNRDLLQQFVNWLSKNLGLALTYKDVLGSTVQKYFDILDDKEAMFTILQDQSYFNAWLAVSKKKLPTVQIFWDQYYSRLSAEQRRKLMSQILDDDLLYPNDLHIEAISGLFNLSILTLHRGKYGKFDSANARGDVGDLIVSSTLYPARNNINARPLIIFNKVNEKKYSAYYLVVEAKDTKPFYMKLSDIPYNIKILVDAHLSSE